MKRFAFVAALVFGLSLAATAMASNVKCTVTGVKGSVVTLKCGKKAAKLTRGEAVKVWRARKEAGEGC
ncbi:MAG TPA: hypothetical protein ENK27_03190 [Desulfobulbus sp.]|nr:hypothetical protein [Desulfobulbus sp.]